MLSSVVCDEAFVVDLKTTEARLSNSFDLAIRSLWWTLRTITVKSNSLALGIALCRARRELQEWTQSGYRTGINFTKNLLHVNILFASFSIKSFSSIKENLSVKSNLPHSLWLIRFLLIFTRLLVTCLCVFWAWDYLGWFPSKRMKSVPSLF